MKITEIHARGLTTTFFNKMGDHINSDVLFDLRENQKFQSTRASWTRFILAVNHSIRNCSIASYEGGSKRKPYFSFCGLEVNKQREFNSWQERCLSGSSVFITFDQETDSADAFFNVGEHAIARVFERAKINISNERGEIDVFRILPAFHSIALWTAFWSIVWGLMRQHDKTPLPFRPIIPTQFGVFLGEVRSYATASSTVEIRTFVENDSLSFVQNKTREVLLKAGKSFENSPLAMYPLLFTSNLEYPEAINSIICMNILPDASTMADALFHHIEDDLTRYRYKEFFQKYVRDAVVPEVIRDGYRKGGVRIMQNIFKKALLARSKQD